ncbi:hypothetical protein BCAR13_300133 [Paraburkholderia caribensis]|nr:hypothetical protein BCAR13_300133 [Paraburkholderia caribensis]
MPMRPFDAARAGYEPARAFNHADDETHPDPSFSRDGRPRMRARVDGRHRVACNARTSEAIDRAIRRAEIPAGVHAFRLCESGCASERHA